jgi:hypothetical protein
MRKKVFRLIAVVLAMSCVMSVSAFAATRASTRIDSYEIVAARVGKGKIGIDFSIDGTGRMDRIGASSIIVYENGTVVASYDADDTGMSVRRSTYHANTIYFNGTAGTRYQVEVTVFAEDADGTDYRTKTVYVTA